MAQPADEATIAAAQADVLDRVGQLAPALGPLSSARLVDRLVELRRELGLPPVPAAGGRGH